MRLNKQAKTPAPWGGVKKPAVERDSEPETQSADSSWMTTDASQYKNLAEESKRGSQRVPEVWIKPDTSMKLRFRTEEPIASFERYRVRGSNGKFENYTKPGVGQPDLIGAQLKLRPQRVYIYEVIDIDGFVTKKNVRMKCIPRFLVASTRLYENIKMLQANLGRSLTSGYITLSRSGTGTNTTYMLMPCGGSALPTMEEKKAPRIQGDLPKYYTPPSEAQQMRICSGYTPEEEGEE